jgi:hypothetical protein
MPKYITIPGDVSFRNPLDGAPTGEKMTFAEFVRGKLMVHPRWMQTYSDVKAAFAIDEALSKANDWMILDEAVWKKLADVCDAPAYQAPGPMGPQLQPGLVGLPPLLAPQLLSFFDAIMKPSESQPEKATTT